MMTPWMRGALNAMKLPVDSVGLIADFEEAVTARARHFGGVPVEIAERARIHVDATRSALQSRLAGEDEVVVKREELQKSFEMLRDMPSSRYGNAVVTLILSWMKGWLAGWPTAQESKDG